MKTIHPIKTTADPLRKKPCLGALFFGRMAGLTQTKPVKNNPEARRKN
ncbi:MAG: hypothetical protein KDD04_03115 [Sinomicrobium sp.]|nr:hypothetical protein [Sinomicrobium sp.]